MNQYAFLSLRTLTTITQVSREVSKTNIDQQRWSDSTTAAPEPLKKIGAAVTVRGSGFSAIFATTKNWEIDGLKCRFLYVQRV